MHGCSFCRLLLPPPLSPLYFLLSCFFTSCVGFMQGGAVQWKAYTNNSQGRQAKGRSTNTLSSTYQEWINTAHSPPELHSDKPGYISLCSANPTYLHHSGREEAEDDTIKLNFISSFSNYCHPATLRPITSQTAGVNGKHARIKVKAAVYEDTALCMHLVLIVEVWVSRLRDQCWWCGMHRGGYKDQWRGK